MEKQTNWFKLKIHRLRFLKHLGSVPPPPLNRPPPLTRLIRLAQEVKHNDDVLPFCGHKTLWQILTSTVKQRIQSVRVGIVGGYSNAGWSGQTTTAEALARRRLYLLVPTPRCSWLQLIHGSHRRLSGDKYWIWLTFQGRTDFFMDWLLSSSQPVKPIFSWWPWRRSAG